MAHNVKVLGAGLIEGEGTFHARSISLLAIPKSLKTLFRTKQAEVFYVKAFVAETPMTTHSFTSSLQSRHPKAGGN
jgi:hypothetical protein